MTTKLKSIDEFVEQYKNASSAQKMLILSELTDELRISIARVAPKILENEKDTAVQIAVIKTFSSEWPKGELKPVAIKLFSNNYELRDTALQMLCKVAPENLKAYLPKLLIDDNPRMRSIAIKGLMTIDPAEAIAHLELLLFSSRKEDRKAGIQCSFLLPYKWVRAVMLKYLASENDVEMLKIAGILFENNPDLESPFRIWEIAGQSTGEVKRLLQDFARKACKAIESSQVLGKQYEAYQNKLKSWIIKKEYTRLIQHCFNRLAEADLTSEIVNEMIIRLKKATEKPGFKEVFCEALTWPLEDSVREVLTKYFSSDGEPLSTSTSIKLSDESKDISSETMIKKFFDLDEPDQIATLAHADIESSENLKLLVSEILYRKRNFGPLLIAAAFRTAVSSNIKGFVSQAEIYVKNSDDKLATSALEYLAEFSPDQAFALSGNFLQSHNIRRKSIALKILKRYDSNRALEIIEGLLNTDDRLQKKLALACMIYFDFSYVMPVLLDFLEKVPEHRMIRNGLCIFKANPEPEALYPLYKLSKILPGDLSNETTSIRKKHEALLEKMGRLTDTPESREKRYFKRWNEEQKKNEKPLPDYSAKKCRPKVAHAGILATGLEKAVYLATSVLIFLKWAIVISIIVGIIVIYNFLSSLFMTDHQEISIGVPLNVSGTLHRRGPQTDTWLIRRNDNVEFYVTNGDKLPPDIYEGQKFSAEILPHRRVLTSFEAEIREVLND